MFRVFGLDFVSATPRHVGVDVSDERLAWKHAISKGIDPHDVVPLPETSAETASREGVVYMIACGSHIKIGKSTNPHVRYAQLKIQLPEKPKLLHEIRTNNVDYVEKHWHRRFAPKRANGEWFALDGDEIAEFMQCEATVVGDTKQSANSAPHPSGDA